MKDINPHIQKAPKFPSQKNEKKFSPRLSTAGLQDTKDKGKYIMKIKKSKYFPKTEGQADR